jgi:hypothetical protein
MKIFLHIGIEKTGSTTIQDFLNLNKARLCEQGIALSSALGVGNNVLLAAYGMSHTRSNSVHQQSGAIRRASRIAFDLNVSTAFLREALALAPDCHSLVLSTEHCHSNLIEHDEVLKVRKLLKHVADDITIIVYLRRQIDVCISHYSTLLKFGGNIDFDTHFATLSLTHFYNYLELIRLWTGVFGEEHVKVRLFDKTNLVSNDLIVDFCYAAGIANSAEFEFPANSNQSLLPEAQKLLLELNRFQSIYPSQEFSALHANMQSYLEQNFSGQGFLPSKDIAMERQSIFDASNAEVCAAYFPDLDLLFSDSFDEFPESTAVPHLASR